MRVLFDLYPIHCVEEIRVPLKIAVIPSGNLPQTPDLENSATISRLSKYGRSEGDKLRRRRSAELITPPSSDARPL